MVSAAVLGECHNNAGHDASGANPATLLDRSSPVVCTTRSTQKKSAPGASTASRNGRAIAMRCFLLLAAFVALLATCQVRRVGLLPGPRVGLYSTHVPKWSHVGWCIPPLRLRTDTANIGIVSLVVLNGPATRLRGCKPSGAAAATLHMCALSSSLSS